MNNIFAISPSNVYDINKMEYLLKSSDLLDIDIKIIGVGNKWTGFLSLIPWIADYLNGLKDVDDKIVIITDAYDVFYISNLELIEKKFKSMDVDILWSSEKWYSHQLESDRLFYDTLSSEILSEYKYLNTGGCIGYVGDLKRFFNNIKDSIEGDEKFMKVLYRYWDGHLMGQNQTVISHYISKNENKYNIELDYNCEIFYTTPQDWDNIDSYVRIYNNKFFVKETQSYPCIVHSPRTHPSGHSTLEYLFNLSYNNE